MKIFKLEILDLVTLSAAKADNGKVWAEAWKEAYFELDGKSLNNPKKTCPLNGTRTLYELGLLKCSSKPPVKFDEESVLSMSKNGWYCYLALCELIENPELSHIQLWNKVRNKVVAHFGTAPNNDEGSVKITWELFKNKLINLEHIN
jgi:hypothetical protein